MWHKAEGYFGLFNFLNFFFWSLSLSLSVPPVPDSLFPLLNPHCCRRCTTMSGHHHTSPPPPKGAACYANPPQPVSNKLCRKIAENGLKFTLFVRPSPATSNLQNLLGFKAFHPINLVVSSYFNFKYRRRRIKVGDFRFRKFRRRYFTI